MNIRPHLGILMLSVSLVACTPMDQSMKPTQQSSSSSSAPFEVTSSTSTSIDLSTLYRYYESKDLGISLYVPAVYAFPRTVTGSVIHYKDLTIPYQSFFIADSDTAGEPGYISISKTSDSHILDSLAQYHPLEKVTINGIPMQKYIIDGVASPEGFIQKIKGGYLIVEFTFLPDEKEMERVLGSVRLF